MRMCVLACLTIVIWTGVLGTRNPCSKWLYQGTAGAWNWSWTCMLALRAGVPIAGIVLGWMILVEQRRERLGRSVLLPKAFVFVFAMLSACAVGEIAARYLIASQIAGGTMFDVHSRERTALMAFGTTLTSGLSAVAAFVFLLILRDRLVIRARLVTLFVATWMAAVCTACVWGMFEWADIFNPNAGRGLTWRAPTRVEAVMSFAYYRANESIPIALLLGSTPLLLIARKSRHDGAEPNCVRCGYPTVAPVATRCPECGEDYQTTRAP